MQRLATRFVPAADEVYRLQTGDDAECRLFQQFCDGGGDHHTRGDRRASRQGVYVVAPSGVLLASGNQRSPRRIAKLLSTGLEAWSRLPPERRYLSPEALADLGSVWRWEDRYPDDGLVLQVATRDLPRPEGPPKTTRRWMRWTERAWNRDWAWFRPAEAASLLPETFEVGTTRSIPRPLVERIACLHLVDSVRGQTEPYRRSHLEVATLTSTITAVSESALTVEFTGKTRAVVAQTDRRPERGMETALRGTADFDRNSKRFTHFELDATGSRWGATRFNARENDTGPAPIGIVFTLAAVDAPRVAPAFIWNYGWK